MGSGVGDGQSAGGVQISNGVGNAVTVTHLDRSSSAVSGSGDGELVLGAEIDRRAVGSVGTTTGDLNIRVVNIDALQGSVSALGLPNERDGVILVVGARFVLNGNGTGGVVVVNSSTRPIP